MLFEFALKNKAKVSCVYLLAGTTKNNNFCVKLAKEEVSSIFQVSLQNEPLKE
jgi:hypothetical protein